MKIQFNPNDYLYHGTIDLFANLIQKVGIRIITRPQNGVDFGPGFYLSAGNFDQARTYAIQKSRFIPIPGKEILDLLAMTRSDFLGLRDTFKPAVLKYKIRDTDQWLNLKKEIFNSDNLTWKRHVWIWRSAMNPPEWDWTFGPVADGGIHRESYHVIRSYPNMNQLAIHNVLTTEYLDLVEVSENVS